MMLITKNGMSIRFAAADMPLSSRTAQGVKGMNIAEDDQVIAALPISNPTSYLAIVSKTGLGKRIELKEFTAQNRGGRGVKVTQNQEVAGATIISEEDNILISGDKSSLVVAAKGMPLLGRVSQGNSMLKNNSYVVSITRI
jgi:DNA gyrase subunit A